MNKLTHKLDELRSQVGEIDGDLLRLLNARSRIVLEIQRARRYAVEGQTVGCVDRRLYGHSRMVTLAFIHSAG
jgi:hypothetical protein